MNGTKGNPINAILMALVGLLVGFIGGYLIGQSRPQATAQLTSVAGQTAPVNCPHDLSSQDTWIEAGFRCPGTDTVQVLLSDCHCAIAHSLKDRIKGELAQGKKGAEIRQALIDEYADRLKLRGQAVLR